MISSLSLIIFHLVTVSFRRELSRHEKADQSDGDLTNCLNTTTHEIPVMPSPTANYPAPESLSTSETLAMGSSTQEPEKYTKSAFHGTGLVTLGPTSWSSNTTRITLSIKRNVTISLTKTRLGSDSTLSSTEGAPVGVLTEAPSVIVPEIVSTLSQLVQVTGVIATSTRHASSTWDDGVLAGERSGLGSQVLGSSGVNGPAEPSLQLTSSDVEIQATWQEDLRTQATSPTALLPTRSPTIPNPGRTQSIPSAQGVPSPQHAPSSKGAAKDLTSPAVPSSPPGENSHASLEESSATSNPNFPTRIVATSPVLLDEASGVHQHQSEPTGTRQIHQTVPSTQSNTGIEPTDEASYRSGNTEAPLETPEDSGTRLTSSHLNTVVEGATFSFSFQESGGLISAHPPSATSDWSSQDTIEPPHSAASVHSGIGIYPPLANHTSSINGTRTLQSKPTSKPPTRADQPSSAPSQILSGTASTVTLRWVHVTCFLSLMYLLARRD
ncbi:hypothetical protein Q7P37_007606 [Cladosporium fusiforme]